MKDKKEKTCQCDPHEISYKCCACHFKEPHYNTMRLEFLEDNIDYLEVANKEQRKILHICKCGKKLQGRRRKWCSDKCERHFKKNK